MVVNRGLGGVMVREGHQVDGGIFIMLKADTNGVELMTQSAVRWPHVVEQRCVGKCELKQKDVTFQLSKVKKPSSGLR